MNIQQQLEAAVTSAIEELGAEGPAIVKQAARPEFGHYQANGIMGAAKRAGKKPRDLAAGVVDKLTLPNAEPLEIAGPGFINIRLSDAFIGESLAAIAADDRLGVGREPPETIVVDYSAPNLAKEMHIGHLRSTTIGDASVRIFEFLGHNVIRANHVGDWGAQFGSLLAYMEQMSNEAVLDTELRDLENFYKAASALFRTDEAFAKRAREFVVRLQSGDPRCLELWQRFIDESIRHCQAVYEALNITLKRSDISPESAYNHDLPLVVTELTERGLLTESMGAMCVFLPGFTGKDDKPLPAIIRKSDGGYPYMATDLAAIRHRTGVLQADRACYFVGAPQTLHLKQLFAVAEAANYLPPDHRFVHYPFGSVLDPDTGKMFKTRDGADVKLADVLAEAVTRAQRLVDKKSSGLSDDERAEVARCVGVGAVKYAELSKNRVTDYSFAWDTMLSFEGDTAPYLQYAYTRIRSVFRRAGVDPDQPSDEIAVSEPAERVLGVKLLQFEEAILAVVDDCQANILCQYLYELAGNFMTFYEACPILNAEDTVRKSRLGLAALTARTLGTGLGLLGIETVEQM